ncbi:MAG: sporulation protein YabP [Firmicutes bacterium]|nr:sporulation protein YabP [Bacillota bacterium]
MAGESPGRAQAGPGSARKPHQYTLRQREELRMEGVTDVQSFGENEVVLQTQQGALVVRGSNLHIAHLDIESGSLVIQGLVDGVDYLGESAGERGKGWLKKLFR